MKNIIATLFALGSFGSAMAQPLEERDVQVAHLTFHAGPVSYQLSVPADGTVVPTSTYLPLIDCL